MRVLVTRPKHDIANHYLYFWTGKVIRWAKGKKVDIIDLEKEKSNQKTVRGYLKKDWANMALLNGHGNEHAIYGHNDEELFSTKDNLSFLRNKTIFMRACRAGQTLGTEAIKAGAKAVVGYKEDFKFWHHKDYLHQPLKDPLARPYMEASNQVSVSLLKGHSALEAHIKSLATYKKEIVKMLNSESDPSLLPDLLHNMMNQVCIEGDKG